MSQGKCIYIFYQVLLGVYYAHKRGYIIRDIKPENILFDKYN
jgi:serine/threonine protein kinase